jgi:hypothetical protein
MKTKRWPDALSDWAMPQISARVAGDSEPVRVFDTARGGAGLFRARAAS